MCGGVVADALAPLGKMDIVDLYKASFTE